MELTPIEKRRASWRRYKASPKGRASLKRFRATTKGKASQQRYTKSPKGKVAQKKAAAKYWASERGREVKRLKNARTFARFKKALSIRIECLRHTSPAFQAERVQEILDWAGTRHSYWVESEIQNAA